MSEEKERYSEKVKRSIQQLRKKSLRETRRKEDLQAELQRFKNAVNPHVVGGEIISFMQLETEDQLDSQLNPWIHEKLKISSPGYDVKTDVPFVRDAFVEPLSTKHSIWDIVQNIVVASYKTSNYGMVLVHLGQVTYGTSSAVYWNVPYYPATLKLSKGRNYSITGGNLLEKITFGSSKEQHDIGNLCFNGMKRWGYIWQHCAKSEAEEKDTFDILFSKSRLKIGIAKSEGHVVKVLKDSQAEKIGVQVGWKVKGDWNVDGSNFCVTFYKKPWTEEIKAIIIEKLLSDVFTEMSILAACKLTSSEFTGYLVDKAIKEFLPKVKYRWANPKKAQFLCKLALVACDSAMSRAILSSLDDDTYAEIFEQIASETKKFFRKSSQEVDYVPAVCHILPRFFYLHPKTTPKFQPGHALYVWFRGVNLDFLQEIQKKIKKNWSTEDVKNKLVLEETSQTGNSLMVDLADNNQRGPSSMFISHTWKNRYHFLVEACAHYPQDYFFNDILSIEQHPVKDKETLADLQSLSNVIKYAGNVLLVSDMRLGPLRRVWCLFELYHCLVTTDSKLVVQFTQEGLEDDSDTGLWDVANEIEKRIANIDVANSEATIASDKDRILNEIETNVDGGIESFNIQLIAALKREWSKNLREQWGWQMMKSLGRSVQKIAKLENELVLLKGVVANMASKLGELLPEVSRDIEITNTSTKSEDHLNEEIKE